MVMTFDEIRKSVAERGTVPTIGDLAYRAVNKMTDVRVLAAMTLTPATLHRAFLDAEPTLRWGFLDGEALHRALVHQTDCDMDHAFISEAVARGDRCYGAMDGEVLATYGWYSTQPTEVTEGLRLAFGEGCAYMYKGYTPRAYRGRRLHGIGMARAMLAYVEEGQRGLVSYVDAVNQASLKSCARLGYRVFGTLVAIQVGSRWLTHATSGCQPYQLRLEAIERKVDETAKPIAA